MQHFEFRVLGLQPSPIELAVLTRDVDGARAMAERMRKRYKGRAHIDVWQAKRYLFTVGQPAAVPDDRCIQNGSATGSSI